MSKRGMHNDALNVDYIKEEKTYTEEELKALKNFVNFIKNDETRSTLACWGNHADYSKGY